MQSNQKQYRLRSADVDPSISNVSVVSNSLKSEQLGLDVDHMSLRSGTLKRPLPSGDMATSEHRKKNQHGNTSQSGFNGSIGFEIENISAFYGSCVLVLVGAKKRVIDYDENIASTTLSNFEHNPRDISLVSDVIEYGGKSKRKDAGIEFRGAPDFFGILSAKKDGAFNMKEQLFLVKEFEQWLSGKKQLAQEQMGYDSKKNYVDFDVENFLDSYNEKKPTKYQELYLEEVNDAKYCIRVFKKDLQRASVYDLQPNVTIPTYLTYTPIARDLFPFQASCFDSKPFVNKDYPSRSKIRVYYMDMPQKFVDYERKIFDKSVNLAEKFFVSQKQLHQHNFLKDGSEPKLRKVLAFFRKISYEIAMATTAMNYDFMKNELFDGDLDLALTISKDVFPKGLHKITSRVFFDELLSDRDRGFIRAIDEDSLLTFCKEARNLANKKLKPNNK